MNLNPTTLLPFLDILLIRNIKKLVFKVCRKPVKTTSYIFIYTTKTTPK